MNKFKNTAIQTNVRSLKIISLNCKDVESTNQNFPSVKCQGPNGFNSELFQILKKQQ